ncbi:MAG TPA: Wadjet anti-phage system protein JetD domain-containing protein [Methylophilus sp.]
MEQLAYKLLEKLLFDAEKNDAGRRSKASVLTKSNLSPYLVCRSLQAKESFETVMNACRAEGAITYTVGSRIEDDGFINRIELKDKRLLAKFLQKDLAVDVLSEAKSSLEPHFERYPVLIEVMKLWTELRTIRTYTAADVKDWLDAIKVIEFASLNQAQGVVSLPINEASGKLFRDTKRIKKLVGPIDVLLSGDVSSNRPVSEVWEAIGLFREEHPVRMAGNVIIERQRVTGVLDAPYSGFPAATIHKIVDQPRFVMTIENQTTFHSEARRRWDENVLLIYTAGMPNPPWCEMYVRLLHSLPKDVPLYHWGDVDEGGFRIASVLAQEARKAGHTLKPWQMHPDDVSAEHRKPASDSTVNKMVYFAETAGWNYLVEAIREAKFTVEQETIT